MEISKDEKTQLERALAETQGNKTEAARLLGMAPSTFRRKLEATAIETFHRKVRKSKRYVVTSAQNATPVHNGFHTLLQYCEHNNAELVIIPLRYKNPTSIWTQKQEKNDWFAKEVTPYLCDSRFQINKNLVVLGDVKTQPTAVDPLSGFDSISRDQSAIFGHTTIALKTVPVVTGSYPKIICTTGAITQRNYTDTKTGKKGEFNHAIGATVIDVKDDHVFHMRQINITNDGRFVDLLQYWKPDGLHDPARPAAVLADWHDWANDPLVELATFTGKKSIKRKLNPWCFVWHDALDFYSRNHHHNGNPFINLAKHLAGADNVRHEVERLFEKIERLSGDVMNIFPYSNHPDALRRWIAQADWKADPRNAEFYLETALAMVKSTAMAGHKSTTVDPFAYWGKKLLQNPGRFKFLKPDESCDINGIKVDMHGHLGPNGSRGSAKAFAKLGVKTITGHAHGPFILQGAYGVGTSSVYDQEYVAGPSSWLQTHCLIYPDTGKRTLINIIKGDCGL